MNEASATGGASGRRKILLASAAALTAAAIVLLTVVLPAEYGWDPLGTGARLGLVGLAEGNGSPLAAREAPWATASR